jgi:hypothetical protein
MAVVAHGDQDRPLAVPAHAVAAVDHVDQEFRVLLGLGVPDLDAVHVVVGQKDGPELLRVGDDDARAQAAGLLDDLRGPVEIVQEKWRFTISLTALRNTWALSIRRSW